MHDLRGPQLPGPEGDPRREPAGAEEVLPPRAEAYAAQGVAEEVRSHGWKSRPGQSGPDGSSRFAPRDWPGGPSSQGTSAVDNGGLHRSAGVRTITRGSRPAGSLCVDLRYATSVAQLVEHRSPKPAVGGSIPSARAAAGATCCVRVSSGKVACESRAVAGATQPGREVPSGPKPLTLGLNEVSGSVFPPASK